MKKIVTTLFCMHIYIALQAQTLPDSIARATEFTIPKSGAFTLLGVNPANVVTPGFNKDMKLDYFIDKVSLQPNIAFEIQPVWLFGFKKVSIDKYQKTSSLLRLLATTSISLGTSQANDTVNRLAYSAKFSFMPDPMNDKTYTNGIKQIHNEAITIRKDREERLAARRFLLQKENRVLEQRKTELLKDSASLAERIWEIEKTISTNDLERAGLQTDLAAALETAQKTLNKRIIDFAKDYIEVNWHRPRMDIGIGRMNTYSDPKLTRVKLRQNGFGFWINPGIGFILNKLSDKNSNSAKSDKLLLTGIFRSINTDSLSQKFYGGKISYGRSNKNIFVEYTYLKEGPEKTNSIAYGGFYKIGLKKLIEVGIRTDYDENFQFKSLKPVISFNWVMGQDLLK